MSRRCTECGSTDIEVDTTRADAVCTNCGAVLESSIIVSDIQFEENAHGGSSAIGTFVSSDSKGGKGVGNTFTSSIGRESREITLKNARKKIVALSTQLRLRPDHVDMAFYFFKLALSKHLTRGRKSTHVIAACVYITCRTEGTSHMLIDFSDIMQIDVYELGRTYLRLSQALCINIPAMDPCLYVMRFAHRLEFGEKTHEVSMTALRLVSRMKKDWIHFGRRPSGLCGAALLIAGRLHEFSRSINDVIKVVKVHESTLRKRLNEFGETPASQLTLEEFMTVDLDAMTEEQDPPSFKAARKKDRERLTRLEQEENLEKEMSKLEKLIEKELDERKGKMKGFYAKLARDPDSPSSEGTPTSSPLSSDTDENSEDNETARFIGEETMGIISQCLDGKVNVEMTSQEQLDTLLMPPPSGTPVRHSTSPSRSVNSPGMGLRNSVEDYLVQSPQTPSTSDEKEGEGEEDEELDLTGIDEDEIDSYIMSANEIQQKTKLWLKLNAEYLLEQEEKRKKEKMEREEMIKAGKDPDKKRKMKKRVKMTHQSNGSAIEAIEKIVQEKKISTKINYDVLRSLNMSPSPASPASPAGLDSKASSPAPKQESSTDERKRPLSSVSNSAIDNSAKKVKSEDAISGLGRGRGVKPNLNTSRARVGSTRPKLRETSDNKRAQESTKEKRLVNFGSFLDSVANSQEETPTSSYDEGDSGIGSISSMSSSHLMNEERVTVIEEGPETQLPSVLSDDDDGNDDEDELSAAELLKRHMGNTGDEYDDYGEEDYY